MQTKTDLQFPAARFYIIYTYNDPVMILLTTIFNLRFRIDVFNFSVFSSFDVNSFDFGVIFFADDRLVHDGLGGLGYV